MDAEFVFNVRKFMPAVSFIIPSYNSHLTIEKTISSIFHQRSQEHIAEVIVVDSSDDDKTRQVFKKFNHPKLRIISMGLKTSPSGGRNIGVKEASGDLLCFIDSDVYLDEGWLGVVLTAYSKDCKAGCGSISLPPFQKNIKLAAAQLYLQFNEYLDIGQCHSRMFVPSCNLFCDRDVFKKTGGFPEIRASEDTLFCLNLNKIEKIWFFPEAKCFHIFREEWKSFKRNQELLGKYVIIYRRIFYDKWLYKGIMPVILFPGFLLIKVVRMCLRVSKAGPDHFKSFVGSFGIFLMGIIYWSVGFIQGCFESNESFRR
jgi:glycosyltransferase involved in cell wall biosynthesis